MNVTLHRYARIPGPGDLTLDDLAVIWGVMRAENLVEVFFHDGIVTSLPGFIRYATDANTWFYGAKHRGAFIGLGVVNGFSPSGNTAFVHLCSFEGGRTPLRDRHGEGAVATREAEQGELCSPQRVVERPASPFAEAGRQWFQLLSRDLDTVLALFPACYRGVRQWVELFGFAKRMRLPGALRLVRQTGVRISDALVYSKTL